MPEHLHDTSHCVLKEKMASPQIENGYTKISNEIMEHFASCRISGREWQVLLVIIRKTYGFNKKSDFISMGQFAKFTGMKRPDVAEQIKKLLGKNLIGVTQKPNTNGINSYIFQKDWELWRVLPKKLTVPQNPNTLLPKTLTKVFPNTLHTKERRRFIPPTVEEVKSYCQERNNGIDAQYWVDKYIACGWVIGKNRTPMKDWKATIRTWEKNNNDKKEKMSDGYKPL